MASGNGLIETKDFETSKKGFFAGGDAVKYAAAALGFGDGSVRLPLWEISELSKQKVRDAMSSLGIL